jgi:hypothetical protein
MGCLIVRSPADWSDCLEMAGSRAYTRKANIYMRSIGDSMAIAEGDDLLALAFLCRDDLGQLEFALAIKPEASRHMRRLCRLAHLTLGRLAETGTVIICHVMTGNETGARMARLVGFVPSQGTMWIFKGAADDASDIGIVRRQQFELGGDESGGEFGAAAASGE